jgi:transcriptional regulator of arginine metabolism
MTKSQRHELILDIINEIEVNTQETLTQIINEKGYKVSQATISRDIEDLSLIKVAGEKLKYKYVKPSIETEKVPQNIIDLFKHVTTSIVDTNNLIIIKTLVGNAGSAGMAIDHMHIKEIIGTIAGDDTLLIITKNESEAQIVMKILRNI